MDEQGLNVIECIHLVGPEGDHAEGLSDNAPSFFGIHRKIIIKMASLSL